jgi:hypothetical protein
MPDNSFVPGVAVYSPRGKLSVGRGRYDDLNRLRFMETKLRVLLSNSCQRLKPVFIVNALAALKRRSSSRSSTNPYSESRFSTTWLTCAPS